MTTLYGVVADALSAIHLLFVSWVVLGLAAILIGWPLGWRWVRNPWFRITHLGMILIVVVETAFAYQCPLTKWDDDLRKAADQWDFEKTGSVDPERMSFIGRMAQDLFMCSCPDAVWNASYFGFGGVILATLFLVPPRFRPSTPKSVGPIKRRLCPAFAWMTLGGCVIAMLTMICLFFRVGLRNGYFGWLSLLLSSLADSLPYVLIVGTAYYWRSHFAAGLLTWIGAMFIATFGLVALYEGMTGGEGMAEITAPLVQLGMLVFLQTVVLAIAWLEGSLPCASLAADVPLQGDADQAGGLADPQRDAIGVRE